MNRFLQGQIRDGLWRLKTAHFIRNKRQLYRILLQLVSWDPYFRDELREEESRQHRSLAPLYKWTTSSCWISGTM